MKRPDETQLEHDEAGELNAVTDHGEAGVVGTEGAVTVGSEAEIVNVSRRRFLGGTAAAAAVGSVGGAGLFGAGRAEAEEIGPLQGSARLEEAFRNRLVQAERMRAEGIPVQVCNGDEEDLPRFIGNFSKGLPHNSIGEVDRNAYERLLEALASGAPEDFDSIPLGGTQLLVNPQAGLAFDTEGNDGHQFAQPPAPKFDSAEEAGEMVELYWMALLRDTRFTSYSSSFLAHRAAAELSRLSDFRGPRIGGEVTVQTLFRDDLPGALDGPYLSQFMLKGTPFGAEFVERRMRTVVPGDDHMTRFNEWLAVQNGRVPGRQRFDSERRYIRNGRDLGEWVHIDVLFQAYFNACLILLTPPDRNSEPTGGGIGCPLNPGNPYRDSVNQEGFGTWGGPAIKTLLCEVATRALKAVWFQKWFVHRRLRPEVFAGRIAVDRAFVRDYPIHRDVIDSEARNRIRFRIGSSLLPMSFPEGSPVHPAYGAGHGTVAGACVTVLKALFDESFIVPNPVVSSSTGRSLVQIDDTLTVGGELNKLASNIATGRNHAGVHWRSDGIESLRLGEAVAISCLRDHLTTFNERGGSYRFTSFDGAPIVIA